MPPFAARLRGVRRRRAPALTGRVWPRCLRRSVHIHHWLYLLLIGLAIRACKCGTRHPRAYSAAIGFCAGGFLQGLQYDDWHHVVWWDD